MTLASTALANPQVRALADAYVHGPMRYSEACRAIAALGYDGVAAGLILAEAIIQSRDGNVSPASVHWTLAYRNHTFPENAWHTYATQFETAQAAFNAASSVLDVSSEGALPDLAFRVTRVS